jgi:hypothetical protein
MPHRIGRALAYAVLIWITGFVWGSIVFMTPALKSIPSIPYISRYPAISPILLLWIVLTYLLARNYLRRADDPASEGLRLGFLFALINFTLDLLILVLLFGSGFVYFAFLSVWIAYLILIIMPWLAGRAMAANKGQ